MTKKARIVSILLIAILCLITFSYIVSADYATLWNPWTNRLDYIRGNTFDDNLNVTGNITAHGGILVQVAPPTTKMANLTLYDVINGTTNADNQTLLSVVNATTFQLNATKVVVSPFFVYSANGSIPFRLLTSTGNYTLNSTDATLTVISAGLTGHNLTVNFNKLTTYDLNATLVIGLKVYAANKTPGSLTPLTFLNDGNYTIVWNTGVFTLTNNIWNGSNLTIDYTRIDPTPLTPGSLFVEENVTANWYVGGINWTNLDLYPAACPTGYFVTQIADETTCTAVNSTIGDFNSSGNITVNSYIKTEANRNLTLLPNGNGITIIGDAGIPSHDALSNNDDMFISRYLEVDGNIYMDGQAIIDSASDGGYMQVFNIAGNRQGTFTAYRDDGLHICPRDLDGQGNNNVIITTELNRDSDHDHNPISANPTLIIHSSTDPDDDNTQWLSISHNGTYANITNNAGALNINSDAGINLVGSVTFDDEYAEMYMQNDTGVVVTPMATQNVWYNLTGFNESTFVTGQSLNGFTYDNAAEDLTATVAGKYKASFSVSAGNAGNNQEYQFAIVVSGAIQNNTVIHRKIGTGGDVGDAAGFGFVDMVVGDSVYLMANNKDGTADIEAHAMNLNLLRIGS